MVKRKRMEFIGWDDVDADWTECVGGARGMPDTIEYILYAAQRAWPLDQTVRQIV
jgi:hypothetical protein